MRADTAFDAGRSAFVLRHSKLDTHTRHLLFDDRTPSSRAVAADETLRARHDERPLVSGSDSALRESVRALHTHLEATGEYPVTETANRWLGEAEAVAADAVSVLETVDTVDDPGLDTLETRIGQVRDLLREVEGTGSDDADEHVQAARTLVDEILVNL